MAALINALVGGYWGEGLPSGLRARSVMFHR